MKITANTVVSVTYKLNSKTESTEEKFIEQADQTRPLTFLFGVGGMIAGFIAGVVNGLIISVRKINGKHRFQKIDRLR